MSASTSRRRLDGDDEHDGGSQQSSPSKRQRGPRRGDDIFERQDKETKAKINQGYRDLQASADDMRTNLENISARDLRQAFERGNALYKDVRDTELAGVDAKLFITTAETAANLTRKMKLGGMAFDMDDFLVRVKTTLGLDREMAEDVDDSGGETDDDELESQEARRRRRRDARRGVLGDWEKIGWMAAGLTRRVPGVEFMYGPLNVQHTKRTVAKRAAKQPVARETKAQEIEIKGGNTKKDITVSNVIQVVKTLQRLDPDGDGVNLFRLIVNPHDFAQTVENAFYTSFLLRDGRAGVRVADDGEVIIHRKEPHDQAIDGDLPSHQAVLELDMETWQEAIKVFGITETAIPHRAPPDGVVPAANAWY